MKTNAVLMVWGAFAGVLAFGAMACKASSGQKGAEDDAHTASSETDSTTSDEWVPIVVPEVTLDQDEVERDWVTIPAAQFTAGAPEDQLCRGPQEDQVEVIITRPYKMPPTEITRAQWRMTGFPDPSNEAPCDNCAEGFVNWFDTLAWLNKLSRSVGLEECYNLTNCVGDPASGCPDGDYFKEGCLVDEETHERLPQIFRCQGNVHVYPDRVSCPGYRLPTMTEWEWAARGGTTTATYAGELTLDTGALSECIPDPMIDAIAWHLCNSEVSLHPVGQLLPNAYGLYDILGNAGEWVDEIWTGSTLENNEGKTPPLIDPVGCVEDDITTLRGSRGANIVSESCRCTATWPGYELSDLRTIQVGFRPVRTILAD